MTRPPAEPGLSTRDAVLIGGGATALLLLPFVTTFDDVLTRLAIASGADHLIAGVAPRVAGASAAVLRQLGIQATAGGAQLTIGGQAQTLAVSWNCLGWQSLVLLALTLVTGLSAATAAARVQLIVLGTAGTMALNLLRISAVAWLMARAGYLPALLFHDYGGTLLVLLWFFAFWAAADRWILRS